MGDELKPYPLARWDAVNDGMDDDPIEFMECEDGDWVQYEDALRLERERDEAQKILGVSVRAIEGLRAEVARLKAELEILASVEGETGCARSTEMDAPRDGGRGGVAMEEPGNCYECMHGPESKVCPACGATGGLAGKVWPSVEGEIVSYDRAIEMIAYRYRNDVTGELDGGVPTGEYHLDIDVPGPGNYRIIVQPLE
jgi:hypothetical protein